uniref:Uncharacterized protein n=1 Tax=Romanomermis culicivorax TaxID=13658 RepID=A0A915IT96_ROMCU
MLLTLLKVSRNSCLGSSFEKFSREGKNAQNQIETAVIDEYACARALKPQRSNYYFINALFETFEPIIASFAILGQIDRIGVVHDHLRECKLVLTKPLAVGGVTRVVFLKTVEQYANFTKEPPKSLSKFQLHDKYIIVSFLTDINGETLGVAQVAKNLIKW